MTSNTMGNGELLVLKDLYVWYPKGKPVLEKFSLELKRNEVVGLIGLNGAGKTTFIKTLSGLLDSFQAETALWLDKPLMFRDKGFKKERYIVFAEDHSFQFFTFREYISYVGASYGKKLSDIEELVCGFRFEEYTDVLLKELSTGNLKKAAYTTGINMEIAASVLFLTATFLSAGTMWQAIHSSGNADPMAGLFMLPFTSRGMVFSFVLAFAGYTLLTIIFPVLALFFAVHEWSVLQIAVALFCACNGCFMAAAWYAMTKKRRQMPFAVLWCVGMILSIFLVREVVVFILIVFASLLLSFLRLLTTDAYVFYRPASAKLLIRHTKGTGSIFLYLLRYLVTNKNYLMNTIGLCVVGGILPMILGKFEELYVIPLGFAILCLNTPICILLSCDPGLEQTVRVLPGQAGRFCIRYSFFIFFVNMTESSVYLAVWQIQHGGVGSKEIITAALIALQSAILSVLLEWIHPIRNWKIESDLWHHPRKYVVPLIMLLIAGFIGMWPVGIWVLFCIVIAESFSLPFIARRI